MDSEFTQEKLEGRIQLKRYIFSSLCVLNSRDWNLIKSQSWSGEFVGI